MVPVLFQHEYLLSFNLSENPPPLSTQHLLSVHSCILCMQCQHDLFRA